MRSFLTPTLGRLLLFFLVAGVAVVLLLRSLAPPVPAAGPAAGRDAATAATGGASAPGPLCARDDPAALRRAAAACGDNLEACRLRVEARLRQLPQNILRDSSIFRRVRPESGGAWTLVIENGAKTDIWYFQPCQETLEKGTSY